MVDVIQRGKCAWLSRIESSAQDQTLREQPDGSGEDDSRFRVSQVVCLRESPGDNVV
jgi:hypothetical protein